MKAYLIQFTYDHWCQGYEDATISVLVYASTYGVACKKISVKYKNARYFENLTIEADIPERAKKVNPYDAREVKRSRDKRKRSKQ
jgi:hypothetical protein